MHEFCVNLVRVNSGSIWCNLVLRLGYCKLLLADRLKFSSATDSYGWLYALNSKQFNNALLQKRVMVITRETSSFKRIRWTSVLQPTMLTILLSFTASKLSELNGLHCGSWWELLEILCRAVSRSPSNLRDFCTGMCSVQTVQKECSPSEHLILPCPGE